MSGLLLCTKQSKNPLYVEGGKIALFNLEEICYYLYNHTYMIDYDFFDEKFIDFCENEIDQPALAQKIKEGMAHKDKLNNLIMKIMDSSSYYAEDELKEFEKNLSYLESKSMMERLKVRADMMAKAGKIKLAMDTYNQILDNKEEIMSLEFYGEIRSNIGVLYTRLFLYEKALTCFKMAYDIDEKEEYFDYIICSALMMEDEEKLNLLSEEYQMDEERLMEYKMAFENAKKVVDESEGYENLKEMFSYKGKKELLKHYEDINDVLDNWKEEYRTGMES